jgi:hypothetical protein
VKPANGVCGRPAYRIVDVVRLADVDEYDGILIVGDMA